MEKGLKNIVENGKNAVRTAIKRRESRLPDRPKILVSIVNRREEAALKEILDEESVSLSFAFAGTGTARSQVLDYLGIGETEKTVLLSVIPESDEELVMRGIRAKLALYRAGRGISFTLPLTGISEIVAKRIYGAAKEKNMDGRKLMQDKDRQYDLIVVAMAANYIDEAMDAARQAGAAGGTIVRARTVNNEKAEHFIGISLTAEQEILLILAKRSGKTAIMQALNEKVGLKTAAGGVIFSLPVDSTAGISADEETEPNREEEEEDA